MDKIFKCLVLTVVVLFTAVSYASEHQMIDTLGVSSKGQYVALEEYGYKANNHSYYVRVKVMNVWKKEYVGRTFELEVPAHRPSHLQNARMKARLSVRDELRQFGISV